MCAPCDERGDAGGNRVEVAHGRPEGLLHVHHDERGAVAVEHPGGRH